MTMIYKTGSIFTTKETILAHGVNVRGVMGSGIAPKFADRYDGLLEAYAEECRTGRLVPGKTFIYHDEGGDLVLNIASQKNMGRNARIEWLEDGVIDAIEQLEEMGEKNIVIAIPYIGCGIGGLDWDDVNPLLADIADERGITFEVWKFEEPRR